MQRLHYLNILLIAGGALVCAQIVADWSSATGAAEAPPVAVMAAPKPSPATATAVWPGAAEFDEIARRPLFSPDRRPPAAAEAPLAAAPPSPPPAILLTGVVLTAEGGRAMIRHASGEQATIGEGAVLDGWRIDEIAPRAIRMSRDGREVTRRLGEEPEADVAQAGAGTQPAPGADAHASGGDDPHVDPYDDGGYVAELPAPTGRTAAASPRRTGRAAVPAVLN